MSHDFAMNFSKLIVWLAAGVFSVWLAIWPAQAQLILPDPPELPVKGYILMDFHSGRVLADQNSNQRLEPASITKLMSAYLVYKRLAAGALRPDEQVLISRNAQSTEGSRMFVEAGTQVAVDDLLRGMVIQSGNDATVALAEHIAGSETGFAQLMNEQARELGMRDSHFMNGSGLPHPEHYMTARDIALLVRAIIKQFPQYYTLYSERDFTFNNITQHNRNKLLWRDESVDGVKTGHTSSAGYCLASSAKRGDMRLISVVLGAEKENDRFDASINLLNYGFSHYETYKLYDSNYALTDVRVWKGDLSKLPLGFLENIYVTLPKGRYPDMEASLRVTSIIQAPVSKGQEFGAVEITLEDKPIATIPLVALQDVSEAGFLGRLSDQFLMMLSEMFN